MVVISTVGRNLKEPQGEISPYGRDDKGKINRRKLALETKKAVMGIHIEVSPQRYRIRFMAIISRG
jgi:hypothetical protein